MPFYIYNQRVTTLVTQLRRRYGNDRVQNTDLTPLARNDKPERIDTVTISGKEYTALYFGTEDTTSFSSVYTHRSFWRIENAYEDFKNNRRTRDILPFDNYPLRVIMDTGQVYLVAYTEPNGNIVVKLYSSDGEMWNGIPVTSEFVV
jgi:hypothetical protein